VEGRKPDKTGAATRICSVPAEVFRAKPPRKRAAATGLVDAPPDKCFWVNGGPILKNLGELRDALAENISEAQFAYHVSAERSDFALWVEEVLGDAACAKALRRARTRQAALRAVAARLAPMA